MPVFLNKRALSDGILLLLLTVCGAGLLFCSKAVSEVVAQTVDLCIGVLLPSLFPFFVLSTFLISTGIVQRTAPRLDGLTHWLFGLPGGCSAAILLGAIGGYPVGAKTVSELYSKGVCTKKDALQVLRFCNNAGPAFLIGSLGAGILCNKQTGILLYALHLISAILIGLLFQDNRSSVKAHCITGNFYEKKSLPVCFLQSVTVSFASFLNVCAFVLLFSVIICMLGQLSFMARLAPVCSGLLYGMLELTSGTMALASAALPKRFLLPALSFLCGWGGLSVQLQAISFLQEAGLPIREYLCFKLLHGLLAALLTLVLCR